MDPYYINNRFKKITEFISLRKKDKILVIGTGVYPQIEEIILSKTKCTIISGDIDKRNIENAKRILKSTDVKFIILDAQKPFPFNSSYFDKIILTEVLEHLKNENIALSEIRRVLKKEGKLILSVPKRRWFNIFNPITLFQHLREYDEKTIEKLLNKNGFCIERIFVGGNIFDLFNLWIHLILKHIFGKLYLRNFFKKEMDKSWEEGSKNIGTDILLVAKKL